MANRAVHWSEGMALGPQHLQAHERHSDHQRHRVLRWAQRHHWGLLTFDFNNQALSNQRLEVFRLEACLRDGTILHLPEDGPLPALDLREALERDRAVTVLLALPSFRTGSANAAENGHREEVRYLVDTQDIEDENTGVDIQAVQFRLLNARLLLSTGTEQVGFDVLPVARIEKSPDAAGTPRIDTTYIPPVISCDAWRPLQVNVLRAIFDRVGVRHRRAFEQFAPIL